MSKGLRQGTVVAGDFKRRLQSHNNHNGIDPVAFIDSKMDALVSFVWLLFVAHPGWIGLNAGSGWIASIREKFCVAVVFSEQMLAAACHVGLNWLVFMRTLGLRGQV